MHFCTYVLIPADGDVGMLVAQALEPFDHNIGLTCNPHGRFDWYVIGGRWNGGIRNLALTNDRLNAEVYDNHPEQNTIAAGELANAKHLPESLPYFLLTPDGQWHEEPTTEADLIPSNEDSAEWCATVKALLSSHADARVVSVDMHS